MLQKMELKMIEDFLLGVMQKEEIEAASLKYWKKKIYWQHRILYPAKINFAEENQKKEPVSDIKKRKELLTGTPVNQKENDSMEKSGSTQRSNKHWK